MDHATPMLVATFFALTVFVFLAIVGGIAGVILESRRDPATSPGRNPAARDALFPILGWGSLFALYLWIDLVGAQNLTFEFKTQLGTLAALPFFYAILSTARLIWRSVRRIYARMRRREPVVWRAVPFLDRLAFPTLFMSAVCSAGASLWHEGASLSTVLLASVAVLLALIRKRPNLQ